MSIGVDSSRAAYAALSICTATGRGRDPSFHPSVLRGCVAARPGGNDRASRTPDPVTRRSRQERDSRRRPGRGWWRTWRRIWDGAGPAHREPQPPAIGRRGRGDQRELVNAAGVSFARPLARVSAPWQGWPMRDIPRVPSLVQILRGLGSQARAACSDTTYSLLSFARIRILRYDYRICPNMEESMQLRLYFALLFLAAGALTGAAQSKEVLYVLRTDQVVYLKDDAKAKKYAVGQGSLFRFVDITTNRYVLEFHEIDVVSKSGRSSLSSLYGDIGFLSEEDTTRHYQVRADLLPGHVYYEKGIRFSVGTLAVPYKYLFDGAMIPGGTLGAYLGIKYIFNPTYTVVVGAAPGLGYVSDSEGEYPSLTLAGFLGAKFGPTVQVGIVFGADLADDYAHSGKMWISAAIGVEFLSL